MRFEKDWYTRHVAIRDYLKTLPDQEEIVIISDAHDVFVNQSSDVFLAHIDPNAITFQSEKQCWPDMSLRRQTARKAPDPHGYQFLCFGLHAGPVDHLLYFYENEDAYGNSKAVPTVPWPWDCQLKAYHYYLHEEGILIDQQCQLFQSMQSPALPDVSIQEGYLVNTVKGTRPCLVHGHGNVRVKEVYNNVVAQLGYA